MSWKSRIVFAISLGVLTYLVIAVVPWWVFVRPFCGVNFYSEPWESEAVSRYTMLFSVMVVPFVPSFVSGFISRRHGIYVALMTVVLGFFLHNIVVSILDCYSQEHLYDLFPVLPLDRETGFYLSEQLLQLIIGGFMGAFCGRYVYEKMYQSEE